MVEESPFQSIAGVLGNFLEWYDLALFGFFIDVIADNFFPSDEMGDGRSLFNTTFFMRPIGGLVIGYYGDKHGRTSALTLSLFLMGIPTFLMGCLPTYDALGSFATFLLVLCRLLQGLSVGGQLPASLVYTVEKRPRVQWGFYGSLVMMSAAFGSLAGNLAGAAIRGALSEDDLTSWGWRIPFWSGILILFVAMYLRKHCVEHHPNAGVYDREESVVTNPIRAMCKRSNLMAILACSLTPMLWTAGYYTTCVWMAIFMHDLIENPVDNAFWVSFASTLFGLVLFLPICGTASDKYGRTKTMAAGAVLTGIFGPIMMSVIGSGHTAKAFFAQWFLTVLVALYGAPLAAWLVENFPQEVRLTSVSLGYNIAHACAAGVSPFVATILAIERGPTAAGAIYSIYAFLSLLGLGLMWRERRTGGIEGTGGVPGIKTDETDSLSVTNDPEGKPGAQQKETELVDVTQELDEPGSNLNPFT